jgi:hypothetical protein
MKKLNLLPANKVAIHFVELAPNEAQIPALQVIQVEYTASTQKASSAVVYRQLLCLVCLWSSTTLI